MKKPYILVAIVLLLAVGYAYWSKERALAPSKTESYEATLTGMITCLTMKGPSPLETLECKRAIKTDDGSYYALDFSLVPDSFARPAMRSRLTAQGTVTPIELLNSSEWQQYDVQGIFSIKERIKEQVLQ